MIPETFYIKRNDTLAPLEAVLEDANGPVDLTGATVVFHMTIKGGTSPTVSATASVTDAKSGAVEYDWAPADTATAGTFYGEFQATFSDGKVETFPNDGNITVTITADQG